jgi:hypothetical protein
MASETFQKRQKEAARREKQHKKAARVMERSNKNARTESKVQGETQKIVESVARPKPTIL